MSNNEESFDAKFELDKPDPPLKAGRGKAIVGKFEDKDVIQLDFQEKDIILYLLTKSSKYKVRKVSRGW